MASTLAFMACEFKVWLNVDKNILNSSQDSKYIVINRLKSSQELCESFIIWKTQSVQRLASSK